MARARVVDLSKVPESKRARSSFAQRWVVLWSIRESGKRRFHEQRFPTKAAAQAFCDDLNAKFQQGHAPNVRDGRRPFKEYAERWLDSLHDVKPRTRASYETLLRVHVLPVFGEMQMREIRRSHVEDYVRGLRAKGLAPPTIKHAYTPLKRVLARAVADEILASNPADATALPTDKSTGRTKPRPQFLTEAQVEKLASELDGHPPYGLLVRFMAYTGLRAGEVSGLNVGDVLLGRIHVHRTRAKVRGGWATGSPKTDASERHVPLPGWLREDLAAYLATEHPRGREADAPLWPGRHRYPDLLTLGLMNWQEPWERGVFYKNVFKPALDRAGLPAAVRLHDLRHSYASICASRGIPAYRISRYMGHANVQTTLSIYTHLFATDELTDMDLLARPGVADAPREVLRLAAKDR